jgi:hypothetical protein
VIYLETIGPFNALHITNADPFGDSMNDNCFSGVTGDALAKNLLIKTLIQLCLIPVILQLRHCMAHSAIIGVHQETMLMYYLVSII